MNTRDLELTIDLNTKKFVRRGTLLTTGNGGRLIRYCWNKHKGREVFVAIADEFDRKARVVQVSW